MYSPRRIEEYEGLSERMIASPLRAIASPIYQAVKQYKDTATKDFDRFYDNLQSRLSPRTSDSRIRKRTSDTLDRTRYLVKQKRSESDNRTSLTPLIERHSLREESRAPYNYQSRHPFFQDVESNLAETPSLVEFDMDDTPSTYYSTTRKTSISASRMQQQLYEERQRMDRLQKNLSRIKRQSSFLAEELCSTMSMDDEQENLKTPSRATTEASRSIDERPLFDNQNSSIHKRISAFETPPSSTPIPIGSKRSLSTPKKSPTRQLLTSPKRTRLDTISTTKLRSTEMISTPGGSRISNRFWREIHGLNARKSIPQGKITKPKPHLKNTWANDDSFWSAEDKNAPVASSFNSKLFHAAEQEKNDPTPSPTIQTSFVFQDTSHDDDNHSVHSLFKNPLFKAAHEQTRLPKQQSLSDELESAKRRDEEIRKRNNIPSINQNLLAELKAKHQAKFIDDSDSYKFSSN